MKKTPALTIGVVIPTKNRPDDLMRALESVKTQSSLPDEIVVVDQSATDSARAAVEKVLSGLPIKLVYLFENTLSGLTQAKNRAVKASQSDILLFIDDDIVLDSDFVRIVLDAYLRYPEVDGVGGVAYLPSQRRSRLRMICALLFLQGPFKDARALLQAGFNGNRDIVRTWLLSGGLSSLKRKVFSLHAFNETLTGASPIEDFDFYSRASRDFSFAIAPAARALHNVSQVNRNRLRKAYELKCQGFRYVFTHHVPKTTLNRFFFVWRNIGLLVDSITASLGNRSAAPIRGLLDGWRKKDN